MNEIINYIMETPGNTNPNVLKGMLEKNNGGENMKSIVLNRDTETIYFYYKGWEEFTQVEQDVNSYIYENLPNDLTPIFYYKDGHYQLGTSYNYLTLDPVADISEYTNEQMCLTKEKEALMIDGTRDEQPIVIIKDTDGIVPGTGDGGSTPK